MKSFKQLTEKDPNTIMIVDALNLGFRWMHSRAKEFSNEYIQTVESLSRSYNAGKVIIACDDGSSHYRKELLPTYKGARKEKYANQTPEEKLAFENFFKEFHSTIEILRDIKEVRVLKFNKCEADDIAAYIVKKYSKDKIIWLMSSDKDWDLLIRDNVSRFSYITRKEITDANWNTHYDYPRDKHIDIKCITGDTGDSIPGVEGVGPKRAISLVEQYSDVYNLMSCMPINSKYKYISNLNKFGVDGLIRNLRLMDLLEFCEEALGQDNCAEIDKVLGEYLC